MQQYIGILLLIAPGFLARILISDITPVNKIKSDFDKTVLSLLFSIPIIILNYIVVRLLCKITTISELLDKFNYLLFIVKYTILTFIITLIVVIIFSFLDKWKKSFVNFFRKKNGLNCLAEKQNVWNQFMNDGTKNKVISIIKSDKVVAKGFVVNTNIDSESEKEIVLEDEDIMDDNEECFDIIDRVYYNVAKDIVIKEHNLEKLKVKSKLNSLKK